MRSDILNNLMLFSLHPGEIDMKEDMHDVFSCKEYRARSFGLVGNEHALCGCLAVTDTTIELHT